MAVLFSGVSIFRTWGSHKLWHNGSLEVIHIIPKALNPVNRFFSLFYAGLIRRDVPGEACIRTELYFQFALYGNLTHTAK